MNSHLQHLIVEMKINFKKSIVFVFFAIILFTFIGCNTNNNIDETNATETLQSKNKVMETIPTEPKNIDEDKSKSVAKENIEKKPIDIFANLKS